MIDLIGGPGDGGQIPLNENNLPRYVDLEDIFGYHTLYERQSDGKYLFIGYERIPND